MNVFKFNSIGKRIQLGYIIVISLFSFVVFTIIVLLFNINQRYNVIIESTIKASQIQTVIDAHTKTLVRQLVIDRPNMYKNSLKVRMEVYRNLNYLNRSIVKNNSDSRRDFRGLQATIANYFRLLKEISDDPHMSMRDVVSKFNDVRKNSDFTVNGVQRLITSQLIFNDKLMREMNRQVALLLLLICLGVLMVIILVGVNSFKISREIAKTLGRLSETAKNIAAGNLNIQKVEIKGRDEVAALADAFNKMLENLRKVIGSISHNSILVADSAEVLKTSAIQSSRASEQIAVTMQQVADGASVQSEESQKTVFVVNQLLQGNQKISEDVSTVLQSSESATQAANSGHEKLLRLIEQITIIEQKIDLIHTVTYDLERQSDEIGEILQTINQIAEQTNLLSLNASIEAARTGEMGKGFAVVADEVRKLAEESTQAVQGITTILKVIQSQSRTVVVNIDEGVKEVKEGTILAHVARGAFEKIVSFNERVNLQVKAITDEIYSMTDLIKTIEKMSGDITVIAEESSAGSEEVAAAVEEQTAGLQEILAHASTLSNMAIELDNIVKRFTL